MDKKRVVMAIIGIPVVGLILTCGNQIIYNRCFYNYYCDFGYERIFYCNF